MNSNLFLEKIKLHKLQRTALYGCTFLLWMSGSIWLLVDLLKNRNASLTLEEFAPLLMKSHGALAMFFLIVLGTLMTHVQRGWQLKLNRTVGILLLLYCSFLICSGWLLYYSGDESVRKYASSIHWVLGLALPALIYFHIYSGRKSIIIKSKRIKK